MAGAPTVNRQHVTDRPEGSRAAYKAGCRCYPCAAANTNYEADRLAKLATGKWRPYVDAAPVRAHLAELSANGIGLRRVAKVTGISRSSLQSIMYDVGTRKARARVRAEHAEAILAVRPDLATKSRGALIDGTGTHRRLRALVAVGYPHRYLAERLGTVSDNLALSCPRAEVTVRKARCVRGLYDELAGKDPVALGIRPASAKRARNEAAAQGWPRPIDWDDDAIDDPAAHAHRAERTEAKHREVTDADIEDTLWAVSTSGADITVRAGRVQVAQRLEIPVKRLEYILEKVGA